MKDVIRSASIKRKIMLITLGTCSLVVLLVSLILISSQLFRYRQDLQKNLAIVGDMVAYSSSSSLMFSDPGAAAAILSSLSTNPTILNGLILNSEGAVLASYQSPAAAVLNKILDEIKASATAQQRLVVLEGLGSHSFWQIGSSYDMVRPILSEGKQIGFVVLHSSTAPLRAMFVSVVSFSAVILAFVLLLAYVIVSRLQSMITRPIESLARTMLDVSNSKNYALRVAIESSDETGQLITGFNEMLGQIEGRDTELELQRDMLETTVGVRTDELRQIVVDLELARDAAEAASRSKSEFLANMSHEIRTPMNGVLGMTELLMGTTLNEKQRKFAQTIYQSGTSLLGVINDILDFSKIEAGKIELESISFDLHEMLNGIAELILSSSTQKGVELHLVIDADVPRMVTGDPLRVRQVLLNLVSNAVKFTEPGGEVAFEVNVIERGDVDLALSFFVRDSGVGIQAEVLTKIFEGFTQADGSMTRKYDGTGLGLTIAKQLAEAMGGSITVESFPGIGSCFCFSARFGFISTEKKDHILPVLNAAPAACVGLRGISILLVEDNPVNQDVAREMLEYFGYQVTVAVNGRDALDCLARQRYVLVLMDCQMPVMDGYTATRLLREREKTEGATGAAALRQVVIALTGHATSEDRQICMDAGMDDYLSKPFSMSQLEAIISRWLPQADDEPRPVGPGTVTSGSIPDPVSAPARSLIFHALSTPANKSPLDFAYIDNIRMLDPNGSKRLLRTVVAKYMEEAPAVLADIHHAASINDMQGVFTKAHYLKSSSANLGAITLAEQCRIIESIGRTNSALEDMTLLNHLESEFSVVSLALTALLQEESP